VTIRVFCPEDISRYLYIVVSGSTTVSRETASGRKFVAAIHLPGEFHGLPPAISQGPHIFTAVCKEKSMLVRIPGDTLRSRIAANGQLSFSLFAALERRYREALQLYACASVDSTRTRIARLLKSVDERFE
jgi:CRP-like cAMP-binding protein